MRLRIYTCEGQLQCSGQRDHLLLASAPALKLCILTQAVCVNKQTACATAHTDLCTTPPCLWCRTRIIDEFGQKRGPWVPDVVGRAWGNRGNARSRQGKLDAALRDYNTAIQLCPWSVDPLLNRGAVLEQLGRCRPPGPCRR